MNAPFDVIAVRDAKFYSLLADRTFIGGLHSIDHKYDLEHGWSLGAAFEVYSAATGTVGNLVNYVLTGVRRQASAEAGERYIGPHGQSGPGGEVQRVRNVSLDATLGAAEDNDLTLYDLVTPTLPANLADDDRSYRDDWRTSNHPHARRARAWLLSLPTHHKDVAELLLDGHTRDDIVLRTGVGDRRVRQACSELLGKDDSSQMDLFGSEGRAK